MKAPEIHRQSIPLNAPSLNEPVPFGLLFPPLCLFSGRAGLFLNSEWVDSDCSWIYTRKAELSTGKRGINIKPTKANLTSAILHVQNSVNPGADRCYRKILLIFCAEEKAFLSFCRKRKKSCNLSQLPVVFDCQQWREEILPPSMLKNDSAICPKTQTNQSIECHCSPSVDMASICMIAGKKFPQSSLGHNVMWRFRK